MHKKSSAIRTFLGNLNRLVPFVGFLLVIAGILGLVFVQKPLSETQDLRSEALEDVVLWPKISADNLDQTLYVDEDSQVSLSLRSGNIKIKRVTITFNIVADDIETPVVTVNAGSGLRAEGLLEVEEVDDGYLVSLQAVPNSLEWLVPPNDASLIKISFTARTAGNFSINFDEENTYIETPDQPYAIDSPTINLDIKTRENDDIDQEVSECNESCSSNADCEVDHRCFDTGSGDKCRLATNPSSADCSSPPDLGPNKQCNEYCANSRECAQGFSCWWNECRNPNNLESSICADLTEEEEEISVNSCGESCDSNADCAINLRCYTLEGTSGSECRLVSNPSSLTCSATTEKTVSKIYSQENDDSITPLKKGDNLIPDSERDYQKIDDKLNERENAILTLEFGDSDETAFDFLVSMLKNKQLNLPTTVLLIGAGLLIASLTVLMIAKLLNNKPKNKDMSPPVLAASQPEVKEVWKAPKITNTSPLSDRIMTQENDKNDKIKELMKKLDEQSKNQNQG